MLKQVQHDGIVIKKGHPKVTHFIILKASYPSQFTGEARPRAATRERVSLRPDSPPGD